MKRGIVIIGALLSLLMAATQSTGEVKITPDGVTFPNTSTQTMASSPPWSQLLAGDRFELVMNNNEAVLDKETGLVWQRNTEDTTYSWLDACDHCYELVLGNRLGWRLPTVEELATLLDPTKGEFEIDLPTGHPFTNVKNSRYWSITTDPNNTSNAYNIHFGLAVVYGFAKTNGWYVLCVRGGHGYDAR